MKINLWNFLQLIGLSLLLLACNPSAKSPQSPIQAIPDSGYISSHGANLFYQRIGTGIPILVLHGGPGMDHSYFLPHVLSLTKDYQFIFFDQRASGKSSWELDSTSMNMASFVEDIEVVRKHFSLDKVHLLGHSWGGLLAMWYADQHADKLASLTLVSSIPANKDYEAEAAKTNQEHFKEEDIKTMQEIMASEGMKNREKASIEKVYKLNFSGSFYHRHFLDSLRLSLPENFEGRQGKLRYLMKDMASFDLYESLSHIKAPTLIIHGDYDATPLSAIERIQEKIQGSKMVVLAQTGHFPFIENKSGFSRALQDFHLK